MMHWQRKRTAIKAGHPDDWDRSPGKHRGRTTGRDRRTERGGRKVRLCSLPGCDGVHQGNGLCGMHRRRQLVAEAAGHPDDWDTSPAPHRGAGPGRGLPRGPKPGSPARGGRPKITPGKTDG